jgi:TonB dependent receptor/TonB-dependent Receptor Plug Domain/Gram-negative bacterial TonB protein C-terminal
MPKAAQHEEAFACARRRASVVKRRALAGLWVLFAPAAAHAVPGETPAESPPASPAPPAARDTAPPTSPGAAVGRAAVIAPPVPLSTQLTYPEGAKGDHDVVLELTIDQDGAVTKAQALEGEAQFIEVVIAATATWRFKPATRDGVPVAARVRFLARLTEPPPEAVAGPRSAVSSGSAVGSEGLDASTRQSGATGAGASNTASGDRADEEMVVEVRGKKRETSVTLSQAEIRELPGAFGDPFRAVEMLPGVTPIASGLPYYYVRGAPPGNVGYFFDGVAVPTLFHFALGPAVLHPAFIENVDLFAGAYPARYGRFAGGIVAGEGARPTYKARGELNVRIIDSGGMVEVPFAGDRGSIMLGGRFSYTGALLSLMVPELNVSYWDYQSLTRYRVGPRDDVEVLFFGSGDLLQEKENGEESTVVDLNFHRFDLRWDRQVGQGTWRHALTLGYDRTGLGDGEVELTAKSVGARTELATQLGSGRRLRVGADLRLDANSQAFNPPEPEFTARDESDVMAPVGSEPRPAAPTPGSPMPVSSMNPGMDRAPFAQEDQSPEPGDADFDLGFANRLDFVAGVHGEVALDVARDVELTPGLRLDLYTSGSDAALAVEPRLSVRYRLTPDLTLAHAVGVAHQRPSFPIPIPGITPTLRGGLQRALQHSASVEWAFGGGFTSTTTVFNNLFLNLTDLIGSPEADNNGFRSTGRGYGLELMLRRAWPRVSGFISYTLSRSERFAGTHSGPSTVDRTHVFNGVASYDIGRNWRFGNRLMFYTGIPAEFNDELYEPLPGAELPPRRTRTKPFYRVDWRLQKRWPDPADGSYWSLVFEVLNTTLRTEEISYTCYPDFCQGEEIGPVTLPSIGVEATF